jgi:hypothetical protein
MTRTKPAFFSADALSNSAAKGQNANPRIQLLRLQALRTGLVDNAAVEGLSSLDVIEPVLLQFGDWYIGHHQLP